MIAKGEGPDDACTAERGHVEVRILAESRGPNVRGSWGKVADPLQGPSVISLYCRDHRS